MRALIVEDEPSIREGLRRCLVGLGHEASVARSAPEGLSAFEGERPDIVFLDLNLPGFSGARVLGRLADVAPETFVVVMSGLGSSGARCDALRLGASDFLPKPFCPEEVRAVAGRAESALRARIDLLRGGAKP